MSGRIYRRLLRLRPALARPVPDRCAGHGDVRRHRGGHRLVRRQVPEVRLRGTGSARCLGSAARRAAAVPGARHRRLSRHQLSRAAWGGMWSRHCAPTCSRSTCICRPRATTASPVRACCRGWCTTPNRWPRPPPIRWCVMIRDSLALLGLLALMFYKSWQFTLLALVAAPAIGWVLSGINRRFRRHSARIQQSMGDVTRVTKESLDSHVLIKTHSAEAVAAAALRCGERTEPPQPAAPDQCARHQRAGGAVAGAAVHWRRCWR